MGFNDFFNDWNAQPCAFLFRCHEWSENIAVPFLLYSATHISNLYADDSVSVLAAEDHLTSVGDGLQGIVDKVLQCLLQPVLTCSVIGISFCSSVTIITACCDAFSPETITISSMKSLISRSLKLSNGLILFLNVIFL